MLIHKNVLSGLPGPPGVDGAPGIRGLDGIPGLTGKNKYSFFDKYAISMYDFEI